MAPKLPETSAIYKVKVLYIVTAYDRRAGEGITPWLVETIVRLRSAGVEVEVLAPAYRGSASGAVGGIMVHRYRYAPAGIEDLTHDQTAPDRVRERPAYLALVPSYVVAGALAAARLARRGRFDLVHVHWPLPHAIHGFAARRAAGIPLVCTFHGVELTWVRHGLRPLLPFVRRVIRSADAVTANSTYTASLVKQIYDRPVERIPFGASVPVLPRTEVSRSPAPPFRLLFVGRLVERKGVGVLLEALSAARREIDVQLRVIGSGPLRESLETVARERGLDDAVRFDGFVPTGELARAYASAHAFVLPAVVDAKGDVEGLGVVLIEALAHGTPVIASDAGGIPDIVQDGDTGLLVPPGDAPALAAAIVRLARDRRLAERLAANGFAHVEREFSWDTIIGRLVSLYGRLGRERGRDAA